MSDTKLLFLAEHGKNTFELYCNTVNSITIWINDDSGSTGIDISKETAIKIVKNLKREIAKISDTEFDNLSNKF